jgi:predicted dehydrogenase
MSNVRLGIVGLGNMGATHATNLLAGKIPRLELVAVSDIDPARRERFPQIRWFASAEEMLASGAIDAVLIATPHFDHTTIGIKALQAGLHVLVEKPVSVHKADVERLVAAHTNPKQIFAAVFNQRTDHYYIAMRNLIRNGDLGQVRRVNWIITNWFRTEYYYSSGGWRATWAGEGGGVLLNQCPHNLDLFQWMFGMPSRLRAHCGFGRYHDIEVEDDVTAYMEFADGATGTFITSTGEAPGTNRLEITGEKGKIVYENDQILFARNERPMTEFSRTVPEAFARPITMETVIPARDHGGQHVEILQNFTDAILDGKPLIAPAAEGIHSVELANAMLMSAWTGEAVSLPLDAKRYEALLKEKIAGSRAKKPPVPVVAGGVDFSKSFGR